MAAGGRAAAVSLMEQTRMRMGLNEPTFVPTPNARNANMMAEAEEFAYHVRSFENAARVYGSEVQDYVTSLLPILNSSLPRVWRHVPGTDLCEPVRTEISHHHPSRVGGSYDDVALRSHLETLEDRIGRDVSRPLRQWLAMLDVARERFGRLEKLRSSVDSQRRRADKVFRRAEERIRDAYNIRRRGGGASGQDTSGFGPGVPDDYEYDFGGGGGYGGGGGWSEVERVRVLEEYERLALLEEKRLGAYTESYRIQERLVWEQLSGLVRDAAWLESYCASALLIVKEAVQAVALCLGETKQPLPTHSSRARRGITYGALGRNDEIAAELAPRARAIADGARPRGPMLEEYGELFAKRGLAQPLEIATAGSLEEYRRLALERVPDVAMPASGMPEASITQDVRWAEAERARNIGLVAPPAPQTEGAEIQAAPHRTEAQPPPAPIITPQKFERAGEGGAPAPFEAAPARPGHTRGGAANGSGRGLLGAIKDAVVGAPAGEGEGAAAGGAGLSGGFGAKRAGMGGGAGGMPVKQVGSKGSVGGAGRRSEDEDAFTDARSEMTGSRAASLSGVAGGEGLVSSARAEGEELTPHTYPGEAPLQPPVGNEVAV
ncbi:MAG: hypothetical protein J3K34DRAFT_525703 [Monoraphidium minutum]|nr:MAG: hypothetical protein J3K34DRAFT_525703 [Monoraphidium minutum]